jgi:hypothetical protein
VEDFGPTGTQGHCTIFAQSESMRPIISKWSSNINLIYNLNSKFMEAFRMLYDSYISKKSKKKNIYKISYRQTGRDFKAKSCGEKLEGII